MSGRPEAERAMLGVAAELLASGSPMHHASIALLLAAAIGFIAGEGSFLLAGSMMAASPGLFRLRTGFDALLFRGWRTGSTLPRATSHGASLPDERGPGVTGRAVRRRTGFSSAGLLSGLCLAPRAASLADLDAGMGRRSA